MLFSEDQDPDASGLATLAFWRFKPCPGDLALVAQPELDARPRSEARGYGITQQPVTQKVPPGQLDGLFPQ